MAFNLESMLMAQNLSYAKTNIELIISLQDPEEVERRIVLCAVYGNLNVILSYYLSTYDVIDWKLAAMMFKHCDYDTIRMITNRQQERCLDRLTYLKDGDV